jgi:OOP family OmpA-OmpF porin
MAAGETLEVDAVEVAALQIAGPDADQDGVADSIDLCLETQQGIAVESTGCAADVAIKLEGVNFGYNSHELTEEAQRILDRVADILSQNTDLHLQVAGHTDAQGDPAYNQWLSLQRAQAVRDYLVAQGVDSAHIGAAGYGGEQPIADNTTKEGLRMNRRVELRNAQ